MLRLHSPHSNAIEHWKTAWVQAVEQASICGNVLMLQWLVEHDVGKKAWELLRSIEARSGVPTLRDIFCVSAKRGHANTIEFLYRQGLPDGFKCCAHDAMLAAVKGGHTACVKWLLDNHLYNDDKSLVIHECAKYGRLEILKIFHDFESPVAYDSDGLKRRRTSQANSWWSCARDPMYFAGSQTCEADTMDIAAGEGHLEVVKWLHNNRSEGCTFQAIDRAASNGHLEVVQWLHSNRSEGCSSDALYRAAEHGHFDVVKWLYEHCPSSSDLLR
ncbi:unnamed protein product [Phytophthora fragariaefolia]|uniref:Unnamed protein product n=1 Tax=Phytophthora fragariaefolia TaxID=1490495 RepID=A0A9W7DE16_9STRA|nr:unnamed protein product [Phytophthora fragariaefolia]